MTQESDWTKKKASGSCRLGGYVHSYRHEITKIDVACLFVSCNAVFIIPLDSYVWQT